MKSSLSVSRLSRIAFFLLLMPIGASAVDMPPWQEYGPYVDLPEVQLFVKEHEGSGIFRDVFITREVAASVTVSATRYLTYTGIGGFNPETLVDPLEMQTESLASSDAKSLELRFKYARGNRSGSFLRSGIRLQIKVGGRECETQYGLGFGFGEENAPIARKTFTCYLI